MGRWPPLNSSVCSQRQVRSSPALPYRYQAPWFSPTDKALLPNSGRETEWITGADSRVGSN